MDFYVCMMKAKKIQKYYVFKNGILDKYLIKITINKIIKSKNKQIEICLIPLDYGVNVYQ